MDFARVNSVDSSAMHTSRLENAGGGEIDDGSDNYHEYDPDDLKALSGGGKRCSRCGGFGHFARECPGQGFGKGKGKRRSTETSVMERQSR